MNNVFYRPDGNPEVWSDKPEGYYTPEEWAACWPVPEPEPLTLEQSRAAKIAEINAGYERAIAWLQAGYPLQEVLSWETQATQARALEADPEAEALFVRALAATKGVTVEEMTVRILDNARSWEPIAAMLTAQRQLMEEAAWAARSLEDSETIKVGYSV